MQVLGDDLAANDIDLSRDVVVRDVDLARDAGGEEDGVQNRSDEAVWDA